jgi:Immunity protein 50
LVKSVVIAFRFTGIEALEVSEFNYQNVIDTIAFSEASTPSGARIAVEVESIFGFGGQWRCRTAEVTRVVHGQSEA